MFSCTKVKCIDKGNNFILGPRGPPGPPGIPFDSSGNLDLSCNSIIDVSSIDFCKNIVLTASPNINGNIAIGNKVGFSAFNTISIGNYAGKINQFKDSIAIGLEAGRNNQNNNSIALGKFAGKEDQSGNSIAIGFKAGFNTQNRNAVAIGHKAGYENQRDRTIAIGEGAGEHDQGSSSISIGYQAGYENQKKSSIAIGTLAGENNQGSRCIAIGYQAGQNDQSNNTIILNADTSSLESQGSKRFYVKPIRKNMTNQGLYYDTITGEITHEVSVGGSGGASFDTSFNYFFLQKPWRLAYINNSSFNPPFNMNKGTFDASSGRYDVNSQRIKLHWRLPPREASAFNFIGSPNNLLDGNKNLETGPLYDQASYGLNEISYNYLPYHENLYIDYREVTANSNPATNPWQTISRTQLDIGGSPTLQNLFPQTEGFYISISSSNVPNTYGLGLFSQLPQIPKRVFQLENNSSNPSSIFSIGKSYQFRAYLYNLSLEKLPPIDYYGTVNPQWNYLYFPDNSGQVISFGNFGPATSPQLISLQETNYNSLSIFGSNNNPNSSNPVADASLNTPFSALNLYNLHVKYGFDLSGSLSNTSKQVQKPILSPPDISYSYESLPLVTNSWSSQNFTILSNINYTASSNEIVFPGFTYEVKNYYMKLNSDLSGNVLSDNYFPFGSNTYPIITVNAPSRQNVTNDYLQVLGGTGQNQFFTNSDLLSLSANIYVSASAYPKNSNILMTNILFFSQNSNYKLSNNLLSYKLANKRSFNESLDLGLDLSGQDLCRFILETDSLIPQSLTSPYRKGFVGQDIINDLSNQYFEISISESKDAFIGPNLSIYEQYRLRTWYLGVDISNILIKDINLLNYPDISNNSYNDWNIKLIQEFSYFGSLPQQFLNYALRIAQIPTNSVSLSNFKVTHPLPTLSIDFFGLPRPSSSTITTFTIEGILSNLNETWRPSNTLMTGNLKYASLNNAASGDNFGSYSENWANNNPNTVNLFQQITLLKSQLHNSSYNHSRNRNYTPQFFISGIFNNNVTISPNSINATNLDISFNSKSLWWDFTWINTNNNPPGTWTSQNNNINFSNDFMNVGSVNLYPAVNTGGTTDPFNVYLHTTIIPIHMMMWCNGALRSGTGGGQNYETPFHDYTQYYDQINNIHQDYFTNHNGNGLTIGTISYTQSNVNIYYDGTSSQATWQSTTPSKAIVIKVANPIDTAISGGTNNLRVIIKDGNTNLILGTDYFLQVLERYIGSGSAPYPLTTGSNSFYTGWRDGQMSNQFATSPVAKTSNGSPCFINGSNITTDYFIETINQNTGGNTVVHYLRILLPHNLNKKIAQIIVNFG